MSVLLVVAIDSAVTEVDGIGGIGDVLHHALLLALIGATTWLAVGVLHVVEDAAFLRLRVDVADNRRTRRARTQIDVLRRLVSALLIALALGAMFMTFTPLRALGASLLASAGVAGAIAGLAAQTTLRNVVAGLQLALTNQLRLGDAVVVEQEWGRVEELTLTHVAVRLWDERRLMLPTGYFISTPFENWTRDESRVLGTVLLHVDYRAPVAQLRAEARRIVERSSLWDRRDWAFQVVDSTQTTMVVRVLASAADGPTSWELRCEIREELIAFMSVEHPEALPRRLDGLVQPVEGSGTATAPRTTAQGRDDGISAASRSP
jgi:small-conductance mechanosensitive channel